jgi:hypothetical protein
MTRCPLRPSAASAHCVPVDAHWPRGPHRIERQQFPLGLSPAVTFSKSAGQTLKAARSWTCTALLRTASSTSRSAVSLSAYRCAQRDHVGEDPDTHERYVVTCRSARTAEWPRSQHLRAPFAMRTLHRHPRSMTVYRRAGAHLLCEDLRQTHCVTPALLQASRILLLSLMYTVHKRLSMMTADSTEDNSARERNSAAISYCTVM